MSELWACGGTGRRARLKISFPHGSVGSIPTRPISFQIKMSPKSSTSIIFLGGIFIIFGLTGYYLFLKNSAIVPQQTEIHYNNAEDQTPTVQSQTQITIMVPNAPSNYDKVMTIYAQEGGQNPSVTWKFDKKTLTIPYTTDIIKASAEAAAKQLIPFGGPDRASIAYLKIKNDTAYVLLDIDLDGWPGASISTERIHPLIEKTLLQFPQIEYVVFSFAPEDIKE